MTESGLSKFYGDQAKSYGSNDSPAYGEYLKKKILNEHITARDTCLDIGVANGIHLIAVAERAQKVCGIDMSQRMVDECIRRVMDKKLTNVEVKRAEADSIPYPDESFDVVYSYSTLLFVDDINQAFQEIARVLKFGGTAILDISGRFNLSKIYWSKFYRSKGLSKLNVFSLGDIRSKFTNLSLKIEEIYSTGVLDQWKYIPLTGPMRSLEKFIRRPSTKPDLDAYVSRCLPLLANRWYFVLRKLA